KYKDNLGKYYKLLAKPEDKPLKITREEIRKYVAQDDENGQRNYFNYLAVKEVKIFCSFPQADLGKIALIDLPGLGDTGIGDQERLVKTLGADVDAIIFVRMPKVGGDYWADVDVKLYDTAKSALTELPINLWSYMILNHTPTRADNYRNCQDLLQSIKAKHIDVRQCSIVNCADIDNEVKVFLNQVLNDLVNSIQDLDKTYASVCGSRLRDLVNNQNQQLNEINYILNEYADVPRQFLSLFKQFIDDLSTNMTSLENELKSQIDSIDEEFQSQVKIALDNCNIDRGIPTEEMITKRFGTPDCKKSFKIVYYKHIVELRAHLSRHFLSLNQGLYQSMNSLKISVSASLSQQLGHLTEERGVDFLRFMADIFQAKNNRLELGFRTFYEFEISYGSLLLSLLRQHLNESLSADINEIEIEDLTPKAVQESLQFLYEKTIEKCQDTLNEWLTKPSEVKYFMFEEFLDRILYAEGMEDEWFAFLNDSEIRPQVWLEFKQLEERKALQQSWKMHVQQCKLSREDVVF
ncbi:MAG: hypothetical protein SAK42_22540, partial [Oscillatoria sp. PMC 1076.18]|nr:hypothetical protein [Oscillatoria sp. PMC 1076.18]